MDYPRITRLYKYTKFNARTMASLVAGKLWFPSPKYFNDPFDCAVLDHVNGTELERTISNKIFIKRPKLTQEVKNTNMDTESVLREIHNKFLTTVTIREQELLEISRHAQETLQDSLYSFGVLSLSASAKSILMWSHYAANHTGICMEFERCQENRLGQDAKPVKYSKNRLIVQQNENDLPSVLFIKHSGWRYEREWRLLENKPNQLHDMPGKLKTVICGARMPNEHIDVVSSIVDTLNSHRTDKLKLMHAQMKPTTFSIKIENVKRN